MISLSNELYVRIMRNILFKYNLKNSICASCIYPIRKAKFSTEPNLFHKKPLFDRSIKSIIQPVAGLHTTLNNLSADANKSTDNTQNNTEKSDMIIEHHKEGLLKKNSLNLNFIC